LRNDKLKYVKRLKMKRKRSKGSRWKRRRRDDKSLKIKKRRSDF